MINQVWSSGNKVQEQAGPDGGDNEQQGLVGPPVNFTQQTGRLWKGGRERGNEGSQVSRAQVRLLQAWRAQGDQGHCAGTRPKVRGREEQ